MFIKANNERPSLRAVSEMKPYIYVTVQRKTQLARYNLFKKNDAKDQLHCMEGRLLSWQIVPKAGPTNRLNVSP